MKAFIVTPKAIPPQNAGRVFVHVHGGGYVFGPGRAALLYANGRDLHDPMLSPIFGTSTTSRPLS